MLVGLSTDEHLGALARQLEARGANGVRVSIDLLGSLPTVRVGTPAVHCRAVVLRSLSPLAPVAFHRGERIQLKAQALGRAGAFAAREGTAAVLSWLAGLAAPCWINEPLHHLDPCSTIRHLGIARHCGLRVPETVITSDPRIVADLADALPLGVVHKALDSPLVWSTQESAGFLYTNAVDVQGMAVAAGHLATVGLFQERVGGRSELRVYVVGDVVLGVRITEREGGRLDWRRGIPDASVQYARCDVEPSLARKLRSFMRRAGLSYAAIDLIEVDSGPVFLEANPDGAYLWLEAGLGMPITSAICDLILVS